MSCAKTINFFPSLYKLVLLLPPSVMVRGAFGNIRIRNEMAPGTEGGFTKLYPEGKVMSIYGISGIFSKKGGFFT